MPNKKRIVQYGLTNHPNYVKSLLLKLERLPLYVIVKMT